MARPVLSHVAAALLVALVIAACEQGPSRPATQRSAALACTGDLAGASAEIREAYPTLRQRVESGPLFGVLKERLGDPRSCVHEQVEGSLRLAYSFTERGDLQARVDPVLESSEERIALTPLTLSEAITLLEAEQRHAFGAEGCGIDFTAASSETEETAPGERDVVYRGGVCNCQARVQYRGDQVTALIFRSAC